MTLAEAYSSISRIMTRMHNKEISADETRRHLSGIRKQLKDASGIDIPLPSIGDLQSEIPNAGSSFQDDPEGYYYSDLDDTTSHSG